MYTFCSYCQIKLNVVLGKYEDNVKGEMGDIYAANQKSKKSGTAKIVNSPTCPNMTDTLAINEEQVLENQEKQIGRAALSNQ